jgi:hypothetical protein
MRRVCRRLLYQRPALDEFFMECIDVIHMQVSEVAVVARRRRWDGVRTMAHHDPHISSRKKLPPGPFWPLSLEAQGIPEVGGVSLEVRHS